MELKTAVTALAALAHEGRLAAFRLLVRAGHDGMAAGELARRLGVAPNTLSANLAALSHAGLVEHRREGRSIIYTAAFARMSGLLVYLMEDCCQGHPEVCGALAEAAVRGTCCPAEEGASR